MGIEQSGDQFSLEEVTQALDGLDVDHRQTVLGALQNIADVRQSERSEQAMTSSIVRFASVYERATSEHASMSNIEGWYEELETASGEVLGRYAVGKEFSTVEKLALDASSVTYAYLMLEHGDDEIDADLLTRAGVNLEELLKKFKQGIIAARIAKGETAMKATDVVNDSYQQLEDLSGHLRPRHWKRIVRPRADALRAGLKAAGFALPELDEDGMFGEDDELEL